MVLNDTPVSLASLVIVYPFGSATSLTLFLTTSYASFCMSVAELYG